MPHTTTVLTLHSDNKTHSFCSIGKAMRLVADGLASVTQQKPGGKPSVIKMHQRVIRDVNHEWRKRTSLDRTEKGLGETLDHTNIPVRNAGGASTMQFSELVDRKHLATEYDVEESQN